MNNITDRRIQLQKSDEILRPESSCQHVRKIVAQFVYELLWSDANVSRQKVGPGQVR